MWWRAGKWTFVALLIVCLSAPWALLQSVAWVGMLANYSRSVPLKEAVSMTFDGEHPCELCHIAQKGQAEERQKDQQMGQANLKFELAMPAEGFRLFAQNLKPLSLIVTFPPPSRVYPPTLPPPRDT